MLTPRRLFLELGGFDAGRFPDVFYDVDYGLRLSEHGDRCVVCGEVSVRVPPRSARIRMPESHEVAELRVRLSGRSDQYYSPHLRLDEPSFQVQATVVPTARRNRPIRTLAVTHNLNWEGAPLIQLDLLSRLKEMGTTEALVLSPVPGPLQDRYEDASIDVEVRPGYDNATSRSCVTDQWIQELSGWITQQQFELVHANTAHSYWAIAAARAAGVPAVWSIHESEPWAVLFADLARSQARTALKCLDHPYRVVFASRGSAQVWSSLERAGNFTIVPTPLDIPRFREHLSQIDRGTARRRLGLAEDEVCVIVMGTVCPRKGQHDLARAYAALPREVASRARCFVVGLREGLPYGLELRRLIARLPADRRDRFTIVAETGQTSLFWNAADLFCCTSRIESYPRVILEAMECGLPIITTPVFGIVEQVVENGNALFYQPGDHKLLCKWLATLITDRERRTSMGRESPRVLRSLVSQEEMIEQYRRIFLAAADSNPVTSPVERGVPLVA
jgi:glycosyltransferase involved in cell wall biosynthesis